jgi:hypothetical protein
MDEVCARPGGGASPRPSRPGVSQVRQGFRRGYQPPPQPPKPPNRAAAGAAAGAAFSFLRIAVVSRPSSFETARRRLEDGSARRPLAEG